MGTNQSVADIYAGYTGVGVDGAHIDEANEVEEYVAPELEDSGDDKGSDDKGGGDDKFVVADHNIDAVKDFVKDHPDQREAVLEQEKARGDDARVTLVEWLETEPAEEVED